MVNYGNSKALVAVADSQKTQSASGLSSGPMSSGRGLPDRPKNAGGDHRSKKQAWGAPGTLLGGEPLAIEYNQNILEDKPHDAEFTEIQEERDQPSGRHESTRKHKKSASAVGNEKAAEDQDGFFITDVLG